MADIFEVHKYHVFVNVYNMRKGNGAVADLGHTNICFTINIPVNTLLGKLRRREFSSGKIIRHLENIQSLFPDENFPQLYLRVIIF